MHNNRILTCGCGLLVGSLVCLGIWFSLADAALASSPADVTLLIWIGLLAGLGSAGFVFLVGIGILRSPEEPRNRNESPPQP